MKLDVETLVVAKKLAGGGSGGGSGTITLIENAPTYTSSMIYDGTEQTAQFNNYDPETMTVSGNTATNAGNYIAVFKPKKGYYWDNGDGTATNEPKEVAWSIAKASSSIVLSTNSISLNANTHYADVEITSIVGDGVVSVESSDTTIATVSEIENNVFRITANDDEQSGDATITVSIAGTDNYTSTSATVNVNVFFLKIVTFTDGTDAEIKAMLDAYYNDAITWSEMGWAIGDTRKISLASMTPPNGSDASTWAAQDIMVVIVAHDHTDLATPVNGHTKACITVQTRECMNNITTDSANRKTNGIYVNGDSAYDTTFTKWSNLYMRTYMNDTVWGAFPSTLKDAIRPSKHYRHTTYNGTTSEEVTDNLFLPSYPEIFGTASYSYYVATSPVEGTQFEYYATSANRVKYGNNNGVSNGTATYWWEGSASSNYNSSNGYYWCGVYASGSAYGDSGGIARGLAPAFAM